MELELAVEMEGVSTEAWEWEQRVRLKEKAWEVVWAEAREPELALAMEVVWEELWAMVSAQESEMRSEKA